MASSYHDDEDHDDEGEYDELDGAAGTYGYDPACGHFHDSNRRCPPPGMYCGNKDCC